MALDLVFVSYSPFPFDQIVQLQLFTHSIKPDSERVAHRDQILLHRDPVTVGTEYYSTQLQIWVSVA